MCGITGLLLTPQRRPASQWAELREMFTSLLRANEARGRFATGAAVLQTDGSHRLCKRPVNARTFVEQAGYRRVLDELGPETTLLLGHTRWPTVGELTPENNQPLLAGHVLGTHNGHIANHLELTEDYLLRRQGEVDSEVLLRLAERFHRRRGWLTRMAEVTANIEGTFGAVLASKSQPEEVLILRREKPLALVWLPEYSCVAYSSDFNHLHRELVGRDWRRLFLENGEAARFNVRALPRWKKVALPLTAPVVAASTNDQPWRLIP